MRQTNDLFPFTIVFTAKGTSGSVHATAHCAKCAVVEMQSAVSEAMGLSEEQAQRIEIHAIYAGHIKNLMNDFVETAEAMVEMGPGGPKKMDVN